MNQQVFLLFVTLIGALDAACGYSTCGSCVADSGCYWKANTNSCAKPVLLPRSTFCSSATNVCLKDSLSKKSQVFQICDNYNCPQPAPFPYNESNAKLVYWRLQGAGKTQTTTPEFTSCTTAADPNIQLVARVNVSCGMPNVTDFCTTDLYVVPSIEQVVAISMGSTGESQVSQVGNSLIIPSLDGGAISYFVNASEIIWSAGLQTLLQTTLAANPTYKFVSSGHSLGGALAIIFAKKVGQAGWRGPTEIETYTFGQPQVGNLAYMQNVYQYAPRVYRVINRKDFVPMTPPSAFGLQHANWAVRYPSLMTGSYGDAKTFCTYPKQSACSYSLAEALETPSDHTTYFGVDITTWYLSGCPYTV